MFSGLLVIELASVLAGPSVGQFFAEFGADVIKVENIKTRGDVTRSWKLPKEEDDKISAYFSSVNWGKKSIGIDISKDEGRDLVYQLIKKADIVIASYKPGDASKLQMDYESLSKINPGIIYGMITGYGNDNAKVGYDAVIQAESGFMFMNGEPNGNPVKIPVALMDVLAAHHLKEGVLVAMINKMKSGKGQCVEVSLIEAAISSLANQATNYLVVGVVPQKQGSKHPNIAPYGEVFQTKDDKSIILAVGNDRQFAKLCDVINLAHLPSLTEFSSNVQRVKNRESLSEHMAPKFLEFETDELIDLLNSVNVPCGVVRNLREVFETKEAKKVIINSSDESNKLLGIRNGTAKLNSIENNSHFPPPPEFGQHSHEVLNTYLSIDTGKIDELRQLGIIL